jgi:D-alanyl-D-alanine carboxypeptidase/D-alanyl-D-alanine-endopeptidase (penicillin-binding protein 4)
MKIDNYLHYVFCILTFAFCITSCSIQKEIAGEAKETVLAAPSIKNAHIGISIYEPATGKYWYDYQGDKYFAPASNTKLPTCYAAMKYLGDSLVGARIEDRGNTINILGTADPTFLHPDFTAQPILGYLQTIKDRKLYLIRNTDTNYNHNSLFQMYGPGWSWADYDQSYMAERSFFPMYGNIVTFSIDDVGGLRVVPDYFFKNTWFIKNAAAELEVTREIAGNAFIASGNKKKSAPVSIPFKTEDDHDARAKNSVNTSESLLSDTLGVTVTYGEAAKQPRQYTRVLHSQPTDSLLRPMMHNSDNFFAEQALLMVANEHIGVMSDSRIIDTLLKTDFADLPQKPRWVDGSGLSRYNLFTPQDMVAILNKMKRDFGMERIKIILPTGGEGTISSYYKAENGYIFAKTGTLSGVVALSGFLYTKKNKLLIFSVLVNNHHASATDVRKAVEKFLVGVRTKH